MPKIPTMFTSQQMRAPKGQKEIYRIQGEELVHNKLLLGQERERETTILGKRSMYFQ
jgi:hypothetical protein